jgi:hypothetical protein
MKDDEMTDSKIFRWVGAFGLAACVLTGVEFPLWMVGGMPPSFSDIQTFSAYVSRANIFYLHRTLLDMFIFVFLMAFMAGFRHVVIQKAREQEWLATLFFGIGLVYSALTLVSDSITGGVGLDTVGGNPSPTAIRAMTESTILMFGSVGLILIAAMLFLAGYLTITSAALPKWTAWVAIIAAVLNLAFIPSMYFGNDPQGFYSASGWGPAVGATFPFLLWIMVASIAMIRKR